MKKILGIFVFFLLVGIKGAMAQYGVQFSYIALEGDNKYLFTPTEGIELKYTTGVIDTSRVRFSFSIGYYKLNPSQDTFPLPTVLDNVLYPGYIKVNDYSVIPIGAGVEYHPFEGKLTPYVGLDADFFLINYSYHTHIDKKYDYSTTETDWEVSAIPKIGLSYQINQNWLLSAGVGFSLVLAGSNNIATQSYTKSFLSLSYYLNK